MIQKQNLGSITDLLPAVPLPAAGCPTAEFCLHLENSMQKATWAGVDATRQVLPPELLQSIVQGATVILDKEPTLLEVQPAAQQQCVTVVGDTHGQYQDVCRLFELFGHPSTDRIYIFNGDYVDRGAWGVETLTLLLAWKWALPHNVYLLRGNHETNAITRVYGFYAELRAKYGPAAKGLFTLVRRMFACLPLAALVERATLILHGGLFRAPPKKAKGNKRRRSGAALTLGTLDDLRKASKGGQDPDPERSMKNCIASDVMWSDPVNAPGLRTNDARGCGTVYGPDVTQAFLSANGLKLIIRSHEGPDARAVRPEEDKMPSVDSGYAVDHDGPSGKLVTLFSAPDYPMFMAEGEPRYHNKGAVLTLAAPDYASPSVRSFDAVLPRPPAESYYDVPAWTDDEDDVAEHSEDGQQTERNIAAVSPATTLTAAGPAGACTERSSTSNRAEAAGDRQLPIAGILVPAEAPEAAALPQGVEAPSVAAHAVSGSCSVGNVAAADDVVACTAQQPGSTEQLKSRSSDEPGTSSTASPAVAAAPSETLQQQQQPSVALPQPDEGSPDDVAEKIASNLWQALEATENRDDVATEERPAKRHKPEPAACLTT